MKHLLLLLFSCLIYILRIGVIISIFIFFKKKMTLFQHYFPFQPVVHNWFIKGRGMYCSVYGKVHIKDPLLLIEKSSLCGGSGFPSKKVCQRDHMNDVQ